MKNLSLFLSSLLSLRFVVSLPAAKKAFRTIGTQSTSGLPKVWIGACTLLTLLATPIISSAGEVGVALSQNLGTVTVFDETGVLGSVATTAGNPVVGDCAITPDGHTLLATDLVAQSVRFVDISDPSNPSSIGSFTGGGFVEDVSLTPDGQFAVVCGDGSNSVRVIDVASMTLADSFVVPATKCNAVEVCDNGTSVLVLEYGPSQVRRLTIDASGNLANTGEVLALGGEGTNLACAPGSASGAVLETSYVKSFTIPGLVFSDIEGPASFNKTNQSVRINAAGDRIFVREVDDGDGDHGEAIKAYDFDSGNGMIGAFLFSIPAPYTTPWLAIETFDINPVNDTLSVSTQINWGETGSIKTYSAADGTAVSPSPFVVPNSPTGICFAGALAADGDEDGDGVPDDDDLCPGTVIPESISPESLGINRYALIDEDGDFDTVTRGGKQPEPYTVQDTGGCSCEQIAAELNLGYGQTSFGCSNSVMQTWIAIISP